MKNRITAIALLLMFWAGLAAAQKLNVSQVKENTYVVGLNPFSKKANLVWNASPDSWTSSQPVKLKSDPDTLTIASAHPIFKITEKKKSNYEAPRSIQLQGAINFRDLGGYPTKDGKQLKWGKIYRSADISKLTDKDIDILAGLHIKMICDLRGEKEAESAPDKVPNGTDRILLSAGSENIGGAGSFMKYMKNPVSADSMIMALYKRTDHLGKKYKPVFDQLLLLEPDQALMFHCAAGKDRTGVGAALILYSLGVDEKDIYADYEATNLYRKEANEKFVKSVAAQGLPESAAKNLMAARPEYLKAAFDAIKKDYGSLDQFIEKELGLDVNKRKNLHTKFLY